ncbi:PadR family transcriptional regulator [Halobacillus sp. Marseille-Q1614]|uniref:PadR family transcriptional regulator n=1 Tax=Halobacillus sp. Marseille-Q1614 TaxID=2709134 RepID=UPI00156F6393|nr:PadR family transcriptional regulator [Halobacillus sp. Marseille-Q1614]
MSSSQILKGILEGCLLSIIGKGETYGYEMMEKLNEHGFSMVKEGSIYPLLLRMKKEGLVTTTQKKLPSGGPKRKYYALTAEGEEELHNFKVKWEKISRSVDHLLREERKDDII